MCGNGGFALQWQISDIEGGNIYDGEIQNTTGIGEIMISKISFNLANMFSPFLLLTQIAGKKGSQIHAQHIYINPYIGNTKHKGHIIIK